MAALSAALSQIYIFKPVDVGVSGVFLLLFVYGVGKLWEFSMPFPKESQVWWVRAFWEVVNPGKFGLKEVSSVCLESFAISNSLYSFFLSFDST